MPYRSQNRRRTLTGLGALAAHHFHPLPLRKRVAGDTRLMVAPACRLRPRPAFMPCRVSAVPSSSARRSVPGASLSPGCRRRRVLHPGRAVQPEALPACLPRAHRHQVLRHGRIGASHSESSPMNNYYPRCRAGYMRGGPVPLVPRGGPAVRVPASTLRRAGCMVSVRYPAPVSARSIFSARGRRLALLPLPSGPLRGDDFRPFAYFEDKNPTQHIFLISMSSLVSWVWILVFKPGQFRLSTDIRNGR